jgi:nucleoid DNA-binding protein
LATDYPDFARRNREVIVQQIKSGNRQQNLEKLLTRQAGLSPAAARDAVDEVVRRVLKSLREGRAAELPGLGKLVPQDGRPLEKR